MSARLLASPARPVRWSWRSARSRPSARAPSQQAGDGWAGWTGEVDNVAVSDKDAMTPDDAVAVRPARPIGAGRASPSATPDGVTAEDGTGRVATTLIHVPGRGTVTTVVSNSLKEPVFAPDGRSGSFADEGRQLDLLRINYRVLREADLDASIAGRPAEAVVAVGSDGATRRALLDRCRDRPAPAQGARRRRRRRPRARGLRRASSPSTGRPSTVPRRRRRPTPGAPLDAAGLRAAAGSPAATARTRCPAA